MSEALTLPRHFCFLVEDLESSVAAYTSITGAKFGAIQEIPMRMVGSDQDLVQVVRLAYSVDGTLELVAPAERGLFGPHLPQGAHHIGQIADGDLDEAIERELSRGETLEWTVYIGDVKLAAFFAPTVNRAVRVELVSPRALTMAPPV